MSEDEAKMRRDMSGYLSTNVYDGIRIMSPEEAERRVKWFREHFPKLYQKIIEMRNAKKESSTSCSGGDTAGDGGADPSPGA